MENNEEKKDKINEINITEEIMAELRKKDDISDYTKILIDTTDDCFDNYDIKKDGNYNGKRKRNI